jgi:DNA-directed RNA polymerase I, II, and III subunit RPABC1
MEQQDYDNEIFQMEYNNEELRELMTENIAIMLSQRTNWINESSDNILKQFTNNYDNNTTHYDGERLIAVKFINRKLSTIAKVEDIEFFLKKFSNYHKIIVFTKLTPKAINQLLNYDNLELVRDEDMYTNRIDFIMSQKVILLSKEEQEQVLHEYHCGRGEMEKMKQFDQMVHYYNLKLGEIVRIERPSVTSGISVIYRQCVQSSYFE